MLADAVSSYADVRFGPRTLGDVKRRQQRLWRDLQAQFPRAPALKPCARTAFADIPVTDIADFRARFEAYNTRGLSVAQAAEAAERAEAGEGVGLANGLHAGFSTGTGGGARGLFVTSPAERAAYTGRLLGRLVRLADLPGLRRIALCLRAPGRLYEGGHVRFFPLAGEGRDDAIAACDPQILVAPPQVLLDLAATGRAMPALKHLYYGAEPLNAIERDFITARLGRRPDPIYQATEGFLGAPCRLGTLHLNEDAMIVEREPLGGDRFRPVVTDLLRRTQLVVRLRLDDILRPATCACGSPLAAVEPVEGRVGDIWGWPGRTVFPGDVEARVAPHVAPGHAWIATGHAGGIRLACRHDEDAPAIVDALAAFGQPVSHEAYDRDMDFPKRRHVRWAV